MFLGKKYHFVFSIQGFRYFARNLKHGNKWLVGSGSLGPLPFSLALLLGRKELSDPPGAPWLPALSCRAGPRLEVLGVIQVRVYGWDAVVWGGPSPTPSSLLGFFFTLTFFFLFFFLSTNLCNGPCSYLLIKKSRSLQACCSGPPGVDLAWAPALTTRFPTPFTSEATGGAQKQVRRRQNIQPLRSNLWFPKADSFLHSRPPLPGPGLGHFP